MNKIKTLSQLNTEIQNQDINLLFLVNNFIYGLSLENIIEKYAILTTGYHPAIDRMQTSNKKIFFPTNTSDSELIANNVYNLLQNKQTQSFLSSLENKYTLLLKNSSRIQSICQKLNINLLAAEPHLSRYFENKTKSIGEISELGVNCPKYAIIKFENELHKKLIEQTKIDYPVVVQLAKGNSGNSTFFCQSEKDLETIIQCNLGRTGRITEYINGLPITINACATKYGVYASNPFIQITGLSELTSNRLGACGNLFEIGNYISKGKILECKQIITDIGEYLFKQGYRGFFGVDLIFSDNKFYFIEINPRFVSSLPHFSQLQNILGDFPLIAIHIMEMLDWEYEIDVRSYGKDLKGNSLIFYNTHQKAESIKLPSSSGTYSFEDSARISNNLIIDNSFSEKDYILYYKESNTKINHGIEYGRFFSLKNILNTDLKIEQPYQALIQKITSAIGQ